MQKFGGIEQLKVTNEVPFSPPSETQVSVDIVSSGVNPVDTYIRNGTHAIKPTLPYVPGKDGAGIVHSVGSEVKKFKVGDRVFICDVLAGSGTLAERMVFDEKSLHPLDDSLSFDQGASLGVPYATAVRALMYRAKAKVGDKILIHGASGSVGMAALQIGKANGMDYLVGTAGTQEGQERILGLGAKAAYCHRDSNYVDLMVKEHGKFDVIIEMLANANLQKDMQMINRSGTIVIVGCRGDITISPRLIMSPEAAVVGCALMRMTDEEMEETFKILGKAIDSGHVKPVIGKVFDLKEVQAAHDYVINNPGTQGKVIVRVKNM